MSKKGAYFGLMNGMGSAGREYVPGIIHRSDRMASTGLYDDGKKGVRRLSDPELRLGDQDLDGVQAEVLYGILGASMRLDDPEASVEMIRIYNEWLADFCKTHPDRYAGLACLPSVTVDAAVDEVKRVAQRGGLSGLEVPIWPDMPYLWDPIWVPLWDAAAEANLPLHFHTVGSRKPEWESFPPLVQRQAFAVHITGFQIEMSKVLTCMIFNGVLEKHPQLKMVIGETSNSRAIFWSSSIFRAEALRVLNWDNASDAAFRGKRSAAAKLSQNDSSSIADVSPSKMWPIS